MNVFASVVNKIRMFFLLQNKCTLIYLISEELPGDAREAAEDQVEVLSKPEHYCHKI